MRAGRRMLCDSGIERALSVRLFHRFCGICAAFAPFFYNDRNATKGRRRRSAMAEALYRKYRPQTFEDVVGQTHIERTLKNAIESDKVSHAYLFCGPRGTGKTTTARLLAKALLCECGPTPSPDGTCEQCRAIAEGTHPDVSELDAASRTGVENVREEIIGRVQYAPTRGRYKIYIIDEVHMLSTAAFNALLKTLEEPPSHVVFVLCTTDPQRVPETIHSRCQRFDFHRLSTDEIVARLGAVCVAEGVEFEGDALDLAAHRAQGGMRDALTSLEQLIAFGGGKVTVEVARNVLGSIDSDDMAEVVASVRDRDAAACFTWLSRYVETGADLARFARDLASYVRDLYVLSLTGGSVAIDAPQAQREGMAREAAAFGPDRLAYILGVLGDLNTELRSAVNARLSFEIALTRMARPESDLTLESLAARVAVLESALAAAPAPGAVRAPGAAPAAAAGTAPGPSAAPASGTIPAAASETAPAIPAVSAGREPHAAASPSNRAAAPDRPAFVPPVSSGYRVSAPAEADRDRPAAPSAAVAGAAAAVDRASAFRAELERRRASRARAASSAPAQTEPPAASTVAPAPVPETVTAASFEASDEVKAKLSDPSSLQRGWQAALADLKRRRAAYGALMLSARPVAQPEGGGLAVEFSRENGFAYSAARKPDISAALGEALQAAFGGPVPFTVTQGEGASPADAAGLRAGAGGSTVPQAVQASAPAVAPPPFDDDVVPYDDADAASYASDADAPWGEAPVAPMPVRPESASSRPAARLVSAAAGHAAPASVPSDAQAREEAVPPAGDAVDSIGSAAVVLSVEGPDPVDPYAMGKKLGFDSMPSPKRRPKGMVEPTGWPGVGAATPASSQASQAADGAADQARPAAAQARPAAAPKQPAVHDAHPASVAEDEPRPLQDAPRSGAGAPGVEAPATPSVPARPDPFASRPMPAGIGGAPKSADSAPSSPAARDGADDMDVADIFGSFGVSFDSVQEER